MLMICFAGNEDICASATVLVAFTWMCNIMRAYFSASSSSPVTYGHNFAVLVYLLILSLSAILHQGETNVWHSGVRTFPWFATRAPLASTPPSPVRQVQQKPFHLAAPRPQRPVRQPTLQRDLEYGLERAQVELSYEPSRRAPAAPPASAAPSNKQPTPSLYPAYLKTALPSQPGISEPSGATPPPLGDWPRSSRKPTRDVPPSAYPAQVQQPATSASSQPRPTHHPRKGSNGSPPRQRPIPPPLDLTRISAYRTIDGRVSRR